MGESEKMKTPIAILRLRKTILRWFDANARDLPWRRTRDPWAVLVSEYMLQQTQVERVIPKYLDFLRRWPTPAALAESSLAEVLATWSGLGYNRRAKNLHAAAIAICEQFGGVVPLDVDALISLPGIGRYTAAAVASFAGNADVVLWDTNIRRIFMRVLHGGEFARRLPDDATLETILSRVLPRGRSRDWHGALMDFGSAVCVSRAPACAACPLAASCVAAPSFLAGKSPRVALIRPQSKFEGSRRQARGAIVRLLTEKGPLTETYVIAATACKDARAVITDLERDGMLRREGDLITLP